MLENGAGICYIAAMLGHEHLATTQIYTQIVPLQLQNASRHVKSDGNLFPIRRSSLWELVYRAGKRVGLRVHPHLLRHSFAVHMLEGGADIVQIQAMPGHSRIRTTQIYTQIVPLQLKKEFLRCHPAARAGRLPEIAPVQMCESGRSGEMWKSAINGT